LLFLFFGADAEDSIAGTLLENAFSGGSSTGDGSWRNGSARELGVKTFIAVAF